MTLVIILFSLTRATLERCLVQFQLNPAKNLRQPIMNGSSQVS